MVDVVVFPCVPAKQSPLCVRVSVPSTCEDNQCRCRLPAFFWNEPDILFIVDTHPFFFQLAGQFRWCLVVAGHRQLSVEEVTGNRTHADAAGTDEIN